MEPQLFVKSVCSKYDMHFFSLTYLFIDLHSVGLNELVDSRSMPLLPEESWKRSWECSNRMWETRSP